MTKSPTLRAGEVAYPDERAYGLGIREESDRGERPGGPLRRRPLWGEDEKKAIAGSGPGAATSSSAMGSSRAPAESSSVRNVPANLPVCRGAPADVPKRPVASHRDPRAESFPRCETLRIGIRPPFPP